MENEAVASDGGAAQVAADSQVNEAPVTSNDTPAGSGTARDAIDRAFAKLDQPEAPVEAPAPETTEAKPKADRVRNPDGTFASGQAEKPVDAAPPPEAPVVPEVPQAPADDAPSRFSPDAKAAWKDAPPAVKAEIKRAIGELEGGLNQYKERLAPYQGLEPFAQLVSQGGKNLASVFQNYYGAEQMLRQNPVQGVAHILSNVGISPQEVAAAILGVEPNQQAAQSDRLIYDLRQQVQQLQQQVGTVAQTFEQQQASQAESMLSEFASTHPRFDELRKDMSFFMSHGKASTLDEAYQLAERLNPAPQSVAHQPAPAPVTTTAAPSPIPAAQTRKAALSVTGAPASGSNPAMRKAPSTARGAIDNAFASVGLG